MITYLKWIASRSPVINGWQCVIDVPSWSFWSFSFNSAIVGSRKSNTMFLSPCNTSNASAMCFMILEYSCKNCSSFGVKGVILSSLNNLLFSVFFFFKSLTMQFVAWYSEFHLVSFFKISSWSRYCLIISAFNELELCLFHSNFSLKFL